MGKTSMYLDETDARRLAQLAELEGSSQAEVLRRSRRVADVRVDRTVCDAR